MALVNLRIVTDTVGIRSPFGRTVNADAKKRQFITMNCLFLRLALTVRLKGDLIPIVSATLRRLTSDIKVNQVPKRV